MTKGKFGLNLAAIAILAFVLGFFELSIALVLLVGFAALAEKDEWLTRQTLQALFLYLGYKVVVVVVGWFFSLLNEVFSWFSAIGVMNVFSDIHDVFSLILYILFLLLTILAIVNLLRKKDAGIPLASHLADYAMGIIKIKPVPQYTPPAAPVYPQPVQPAAPAASYYQQPVQPAAPAPEAAPAAPVAPVAPIIPEAPVAPPGWTCSCGRENNGNFCMSCGNPRPK